MSAENILKRIKQESDEQCAQIINEAKQKAARIMEDAKATAQQKQSEILAKAQSDCEELVRRRIQIAELDVRKSTLQAKRELLDEAMSGAMKNICSLPQGDWEKLMVKSVANTAITGSESICVRADEKARFEAILPKINAELQKSGKQGNITMAAESAGISGGFTLLGEKMELNNSFEVMLRETRDQIENKVAKMLFPVEV